MMRPNHECILDIDGCGVDMNAKLVASIHSQLFVVAPTYMELDHKEKTWRMVCVSEHQRHFRFAGIFGQWHQGFARIGDIE